MATQTKSSPAQQINAKKKSLLPAYFWVLSFLKPYRKEVSLFIMCNLFIIGVQMSIPKFIQFFIDDILPSHNYNLLIYIIVIVAGLLIIMFVFTVISNRLQCIIQEKAARDLQYAMFDKLRALGFSYYERHPTGETLSLFNTEVTAVQQIYHRYFPSLITNIIMFIVAACFIFSIHIPLSLIIIPCFLSYYLIGPYFERKAAEYARETQNLRSVYNQKLYDSVSALLELRASRREEWDLQRTLTNQDAMLEMNLKQLFMNYARGLVRRVTVQWGAVAVFAYGAYLVYHDHISTGAFVAFIFYYFLVIGYLTYIVTNTTEQKVLVFQADRLYEFILEKEDVKESQNPVTLPEIVGDLSFRNVHFGYPAMPDVINGFNLNIQSGEKVALVGTTGNGKSTLIKLIGRFYDPQQGEITMDGVPLQSLSMKQLRESLGFVFQETYLFGATIADNIRFGHPEATDKQVHDAAIAAYAHDFITQLADGYDTFVGERGVKLSGGQKQRIAIARMFIKNPRIVLLDEATSALDNASEWEVQQALHKLLDGRTTISVAHRLSTVRHFDRIVVIENGQNHEMGTYDELIEQGGLFYHLVHGEENKHE